MTRKKGFQVDDCEGMCGDVEDLLCYLRSVGYFWR
jgi:hypothetical protein